MTAAVFLFGLAAVLAVAAIGVSLFSVWRSQALVELSDRRAAAQWGELQAMVAGLQKVIDSQASELADLRREPLPPGMPALPRGGLNLCKRSQVLRMHRTGDPPEKIAAALEVPRQEVDLLIKVHRIVIGSHS